MAPLKITVDNKVTVLTWLRNQLNKDSDIFLDNNVAKRELSKFFILKRKGSKKDVYLPDLEISPTDTERFVNLCLNPNARKKLSVTLRVTASRLGTSTLQVKIDGANKRKLEYLVKKTGLTNVEVINRLIDMSRIWTDSEGNQLDLSRELTRRQPS